MPSSGVNEKIGQAEQREVQEIGGDIGNLKKAGNIYHEVIVRSSYNKENMDGVLDNHSQENGDDSCEEFIGSSRLSSAANSESSGRSDKEKDSLFCRIIRSPSFTKRGSIGNVLNSLYPNTRNEGPASCASTNKSGASMGLPEANQSGTTDVPKSKNIKKSASNAESLIVQKNVVDRCQRVQRTRRNSIASYKPMTGALESSLKDSVQNGRWNSGKDPVISCETVCNVKSNLNSNNSTKNSVKTRTSSSDHVSHIRNGYRDPGGVKVELKTSDLTNPSCGMGKSQSRVDHRGASPKPIRLTKRDGRNDPQIGSETPCTVKGKCSPSLPSRGIDPSERKSSATIMKRPPVAIVIPNDKTEKKGNALERYQVPNVVSFINSNFKPLGQEEAEEYSMMKREEARKSSKNASRITCSDEEGRMICKLGTATRPPLVEDSQLPTNKRFVALSERFASLKAKIRGNEVKQNSQFSSLASSGLRHCSSGMSDALDFSKYPTAFEAVPNGEFQDRLSGISDGLLDHKIEKTSLVKDGGKQSGTIASQNSGAHRMAITFNVKEIERKVDKQFSKHVGRAYVYETEGDINWDRSVDENNNEISNSLNDAPKIDVTFDRIGSLDKTALVRLESFAPRMRTSVVAKLMDRKMIFRRRQSIEPKMMKRQSMVYDKYSSSESGIPRTFEQFEWIRAHVESTVLREPVRHEVRSCWSSLFPVNCCAKSKCIRFYGTERLKENSHCTRKCFRS